MYHLEVQGHTIEIPIEEDSERAPFVVGHGRAYVALQSPHNANYRLLCFDIETESLVWDEWVWVQVGARPGYGGQHMAEVLLWDDRVAVFGVSGEGNYVAIFNAETGSSILRFTPALARTADWFIPSADGQQKNE